MVYKYIFLSEAQEEYEEALYWYLEKGISVAENFVNAVDNALLLICDHPLRWRNFFDIYFELSLKKFPFNIVYIVDSERKLVIVTSVYHHRKNPEKKYRK